MKRTISMLALAVAATLLAGCAVLNQLVPRIDDPLGLNGVNVSFVPTSNTLGAPAPIEVPSLSANGAGLTVPATSVPYEIAFAGRFSEALADYGEEGIPAILTLQTDISFSQVVLRGTTSSELGYTVEMPARLSVTYMDLSMLVYDRATREGMDYIAVERVEAGVPVFTLTKEQCNEAPAAAPFDAVVTCTYRYDGERIDGLTIYLGASEIVDFKAVLAGGNIANPFLGDLRVAFEEALGTSPEFEMTATLNTRDAVVTYF